MNIFSTGNIIGALLVYLSGALLTPLPFSIYYNDGVHLSFIYSALITFIVGLSLHLIGKQSKKIIDHKTGFAIVTLSWISFSLFGALPYLLSNSIPGIIDATFEAMSGFTTTGSTIIPDLRIIPKSILFWRAETQWLGGMGIVVLSIAVLPFFGIGGMQLFQAEVPGITKDKLSPKIQDTAKLLWRVYFLFTFAEIILLLINDMSFFDAICHSFTTLATGGFSTYNESIAAFDNPYIHWIITIFMFLAGINFTLHFRALQGRPLNYFSSEEFRFYFLIFYFTTAIFTFTHLDLYDSFFKNLTDSAFQVVSILTSTGYATTNYELWPVFSQFILLVLMIIGSSAGSTGGGTKVIRILLMIKHGIYQVFKLIHPSAIKTLKIDHRPIGENIIQRILGFFSLYLAIFIIASIILTMFDLNILTSTSAVISCLSNIGPGLGTVGPIENYAHLPALVKIILSLCMLIGRLEIFTVIVLFFPSFWKK